MFGPILAREWMVSPRRLTFYVQRATFVLVLFSLVCTAWALMAGIQQVRNLGDLSRFGSMVFQIVMPLELIVTMFLAAVTAASAVSQEKDRRTLILLLLTRLNSSEIVLGKLTSSLIGIANLVFAAFPLLLVISLLGGVSVSQVVLGTAIVLVTSFWCAALSNLFAFWREKTFQTLALTMLAITGWLVFCEAIAAGIIAVVPGEVAEILSPVRALWAVCQPISQSSWNFLPGGAATVHCVLAVLVGCLWCTITVMRLRVWNPSRQVQMQTPEPDETYDALSPTSERTRCRQAIMEGASPSTHVEQPSALARDVHVGLRSKTVDYSIVLLVAVRSRCGRALLVGILGRRTPAQPSGRRTDSRLSANTGPVFCNLFSHDQRPGGEFNYQ